MKVLTIFTSLIAATVCKEHGPAIVADESPLAVIPYTKVTDKVFMDIAEDGKPLGRFVFGMFGESHPKTVANFVTIANGSHIGIDGKPLHYKDTRFHRILHNFMAQGGDVTFKNGAGQESIYGNRFPDENFLIPMKRPYMLAMANAGPNDNGSQFFVTMREVWWL